MSAHAVEEHGGGCLYAYEFAVFLLAYRLEFIRVLLSFNFYYFKSAENESSTLNMMSIFIWFDIIFGMSLFKVTIFFFFVTQLLV